MIKTIFFIDSDRHFHLNFIVTVRRVSREDRLKLVHLYFIIIVNISIIIIDINDNSDNNNNNNVIISNNRNDILL